MNIFIFIFILFLVSCTYPDIDSVPNFNLKKTIQERCSFVDTINIEDKETCRIMHIINRL